MKRIISAIIGIFLIGVVIYLGLKSGDDNKYIVPFGLTSALIAPMGLSALERGISLTKYLQDKHFHKQSCYYRG